MSVLARLVAAVVVATAAMVGAGGAASAAPCPAGSVTAVVEYNELGGGTQVRCGSGKYAGDAFGSAGFNLAEQPGQPGSVCQVNRRPGDGQCWGTDRFWSLWWSDGKSGWKFSQVGAYSLKIPAGGVVALSWHQGSGTAQAPGYRPLSAQPKPRPKPQPTPSATSSPTPQAKPSASAQGAAPDRSSPSTKSAEPEKQAAKQAKERKQDQGPAAADDEALVDDIQATAETRAVVDAESNWPRAAAVVLALIAALGWVSWRRRVARP